VNAGWHQVIFKRDVDAVLTPVSIGTHRLMLVDDGRCLQAYDATCPHRGAHLAHGGLLEDHVVVCPFHGRQIGLGTPAHGPLHVAGHPTLDYGGAVFVLPFGHYDTGLAEFLASLAQTHCFVPAFALDAPVPPEIVIENVFDTDHFTTVHGISRRPALEVRGGPAGRLEVEAVFETVAPRLWGGTRDATATAIRTRFLARVFSPGVVVTEVGDIDQPQVVITAATAHPGGGCTVRVTLAIWDGGGSGPAEHETIIALGRDSRLAFEQDMAVWAHLDLGARNVLDESDAPVREFRRFCEKFTT
jgi:phenylpropionate dioxygenase-like ring-hydroxylating dioxygenase large terminal subunit